MTGEQLFSQAQAQLRTLQVREALRLFNLSEQAGYDADSCAGGRWMCHMLSANFESAWAESDSISNRGNPDPNRFWDGKPLADHHVLIRCLHGLGDTIQFIRYARLIREQARSLVIEAQPTLKSLLASSNLADEVITWGEPEPHWDQQIEVIELPRIFRTTLESIPNHVPYLHVPSEPFAQERDGCRALRVGLVWRSSSYNPERSIPLNLLADLFTLPGASFFSLQAGPHQRELDPWSKQIPSFYSGSDCVKTMAQKLATLDLVISVDTMIAHLAGAMGLPVWTLLSYQPDWRWMLKREDSPWYPTMRLFRQPRPGDWESVVRYLKRALDLVIRCGARDPLQTNRSAMGDLMSSPIPES